MTTTAPFAALAERHLAFVDAHVEIEDADLPALIALLGQLITGGATLPDVQPTQIPKVGVARGRLPVVAAAGTYWSISNPLDGVGVAEAPAAGLGDLGDDLGDIASDLAEGLAYWRLGHDAGRQEAVWRWRFGFHAHWGVHAADALAVLVRIRR